MPVVVQEPDDSLSVAIRIDTLPPLAPAQQQPDTPPQQEGVPAAASQRVDPGYAGSEADHIAAGGFPSGHAAAAAFGASDGGRTAGNDGGSGGASRPAQLTGSIVAFGAVGGGLSSAPPQAAAGAAPLARDCANPTEGSATGAHLALAHVSSDAGSQDSAGASSGGDGQGGTLGSAAAGVHAASRAGASQGTAHDQPSGAFGHQVLTPARTTAPQVNTSAPLCMLYAAGRCLGAKGWGLYPSQT